MKDKRLATKYTQRLQKIVVDELEKIKDEIILKDADGYLIFDQYRLKLVGDVYELYAHETLRAEFFSSAAAVAYCMAERRGYHKLAMHIYNEDSLVQRRTDENNFYLGRIAATKDVEKIELYRLKWEENYSRLKHHKAELRKRIEMAKYYYSL